MTEPEMTDEGAETSQESTRTGRPVEPSQDAGDTITDDTTFPRQVVTDLRREAAGYRDRAKTAETRADELAHALFTARVEATGKLASADELTFNAALLDDRDALNAAIDELIARKPYVQARKISGDVGQGRRNQVAPVDFSSLFR